MGAACGQRDLQAVIGLSFTVEHAGSLDHAFVNLGISEDIRSWEISMSDSRPVLTVPVVLGHIHNEKFKSGLLQ